MSSEVNDFRAQMSLIPYRIEELRRFVGQTGKTSIGESIRLYRRKEVSAGEM